MKYYELNGKGNELGSKDLQCPVCGNAAILMVEGVKRRIKIVINASGSLSFIDSNDSVVISEDQMLSCPQCGIGMVDHVAVVDYHKKEHCPGCIICGQTSSNILNTCKGCVLKYNDIATNCEECRYNYSRRQMGINIGELKSYLNIEMAETEYGGYQINLFSNNVRRHSFKKSSDIGGGPIYEAII